MGNDMKKIKLDIVGLSYSQTQSGAYALVLGEVSGRRRLPIIIGAFEAQAIAIEIEKMTPSRPLTHDLFKSFGQAYHINVQEIIIYNLVDGIFYSKLIRSDGKKVVEIDARTSDAIAVAGGYRLVCPELCDDGIIGSFAVTNYRNILLGIERLNCRVHPSRLPGAVFVKALQTIFA